MDILSNGRSISESTCSKRKRKSSDSSDPLNLPRKVFIPTTVNEDYNTDSTTNSDHYTSSPAATPPSITSILSPPDTIVKLESNTTSQGNIRHESIYDVNVPCFVTPMSDIRCCPLPALAWAEKTEIWKLMCRKDEKASLDRTPDMLANHPGLTPRMRAILLDWIIEVCEVHKLHRETYYLAVDNLDRFLSIKSDVTKTPKNRLQLVGITCLFIAAKVEEIYPPKIGEFAYVTDGACEEEDIVNQELVILSALKWQTSPITVIGWLSVYMQLYVNNRTAVTLNKNLENTDRQNEGDAFLFPQYSGMQFVRATQLLDLCTLDVGIASFSYSVLAAAAISHTLNKSVALKVSGFEWNVIEPCYRWMQPYYDVINESPDIVLLEQNEPVKIPSGMWHICPYINTDDSHMIQTHNTSLNMLDKVLLKIEKPKLELEKIKRQEASPAQIPNLICPEGILTPPASIRKFNENTQPRNVHQKEP